MSDLPFTRSDLPFDGDLPFDSYMPFDNNEESKTTCRLDLRTGRALPNSNCSTTVKFYEDYDSKPLYDALSSVMDVPAFSSGHVPQCYKSMVVSNGFAGACPAKLDSSDLPPLCPKKS